MNFNDRLADLRRKRGLSQEQLGYELGVSRQTVSKWELGGPKGVHHSFSLKSKRSSTVTPKTRAML